MIWGRTLASCSIPATIRREFVRFTVGDYVMLATGSRLIVDGYRRVEVGAPTLDINNIPDTLVFKDADVVERCDLTEATLCRSVKKVIPDINVASVVKALENNNYVVFSGLNITITELGRNLLAAARECFSEMLWPEFLLQSDARLRGIEKGTLSKFEALDDYRRWIDSKIL
jgi:DNA topoisomerase IA